MEKVSKEELINMKQKLKQSKEFIQSLEEKLNILMEEDSVIKYIESSKEYRKKINLIKDLVEEIKYQEMLNCNHYFVITKEIENFDGHRTDTYNFATCIKCGLTNEHMFDYYSPYVGEYAKMNEIYKSNRRYTFHGHCDHSELEFYKQEYVKFKEDNPMASDNDFEEHMVLVKKRKGGKLC